MTIIKISSYQLCFCAGCYDCSGPIKTEADYYQRRRTEGALLRTVGSCEGKDKTMRRGSAAAQGEAGREGEGLKEEDEEEEEDREAVGISILIDLCL